MPDVTTKTVNIDFVSHGLDAMVEHLKANKQTVEDFRTAIREGSEEQAASARFMLEKAGIPFEAGSEVGGGRGFKMDVEQSGHTLIRTLTGMNLQFTSLSMVVGFLVTQMIQFQGVNAETQRGVQQMAATYGDHWRDTGVGLKNMATYGYTFGLEINKVREYVSQVGMAFSGLGLAGAGGGRIQPSELFGPMKDDVRDLINSQMSDIVAWSAAMNMSVGDTNKLIAEWGRRYDWTLTKTTSTMGEMADHGEKIGVGYRQYLEDLKSSSSKLAVFGYNLYDTRDSLDKFEKSIKASILGVGEFIDVMSGAGKMGLGQQAFLLQDPNFVKRLQAIAMKQGDEGVGAAGRLGEAQSRGDIYSMVYIMKQITSLAGEDVTREIFKFAEGFARQAQPGIGAEGARLFATEFARTLGMAVAGTMPYEKIEATWNSVMGFNTAIEKGKGSVGDFNEVVARGKTILQETAKWEVQIQNAMILIKDAIINPAAGAGSLTYGASDISSPFVRSLIGKAASDMLKSSPGQPFGVETFSGDIINISAPVSVISKMDRQSINTAVQKGLGVVTDKTIWYIGNVKFQKVQKQQKKVDH